jgi:site-specific DNA-methyltransferase (adenine-specific)
MKTKSSFTTNEAAQYIGVSIATIYRMEKKRLIISSKTPGGQRRFNKDILDKYLKNSYTIEAPQNPSKYRNKPTVSNISESISVYRTQIKQPYYYNDSLAIYNDDILAVNSIDDKSIDLIVTSPPYNVDIQYNSHNDTMSYDDYLSFTKKWLKRCYDFLKDDGRFCLNIPLDKNKGGQQSVCADITSIAKQVGFKYHSTIIWNEQNISRRTAWGSWLSAAAPYVIAPVEVIVVLYKKSWKKTSGSKKSDITRKEFMDWTNGVWNFSGESKKRVGHPAPFPVELPKRCIKLFSFVGDMVLDPFLGSGSALIACIQTNRKGIGIEIDKGYCELAKKRIIKECDLDQLKL